MSEKHSQRKVAAHWLGPSLTLQKASLITYIAFLCLYSIQRSDGLTGLYPLDSACMQWIVQVPAFNMHLPAKQTVPEPEDMPSDTKLRKHMQ